MKPYYTQWSRLPLTNTDLPKAQRMNNAPRFTTPERERLAKTLATCLDIANADDRISSQRSVYGHIADALSKLMTIEFGEEVAEDALSSSTWASGDWEGQCLPAIAEALDNAADERARQIEREAYDQRLAELLP